MKTLSCSRNFQLQSTRIALVLSLAITFAVALRGEGAILLDDDWDDGDRTDTNLPEESAWFGSTTANIATLTTATGSLTGNVLVMTTQTTNSSSRLWITHFTPAGSPVELGVKDMLKVTLHFTPRNVTTNPPFDRGFRLGLFNFSEPGAERVTGDGFSTGTGPGAPGTNVTGYMLNMNFAQTFTVTPLQIMKRTGTTAISLMGTTSAYTALGGSGGGMAGSPGFRNDVTYTFELLVKGLGSALEITTTFTDTDGWRITHTATDTANPTFRFDGFAIRPASVADTADTFVFTRFKVETIPFVPRMTIVAGGFDAQISWETIPGRMYRLESQDMLNPSDPWTPRHTVTAAGESESFTELDFTSRDQRFYRVVQLAVP